MGAEANRQAFERFLVTEKGYRPDEIEVDAPIRFEIDGELYESRVDLFVRIAGISLMAIKCAAGSLGSWEREILAAARLMEDRPVPLSVVTDAKTAIVMETVSGKKVGTGLNAVWTRSEARQKIDTLTTSPLPTERIQREKLIFRSYDSMNVNRS
jgi:ABC-type bacteriocin/lantibiotic exporter with double-glycine peptidase domain